MMIRMAKAVKLLLLLLILLNVVFGQSVSTNQGEETCSEHVYSPKEVSRKAKLIDIPIPQYTEEARAKGVRGTVIVSAVLCRNGKVTDIKVLKSLPHGLTESAVESTRRIKFEPAEKDGQQVSQSFRRECTFSLF